MSLHAEFRSVREQLAIELMARKSFKSVKAGARAEKARSVRAEAMGHVLTAWLEAQSEDAARAFCERIEAAASPSVARRLKDHPIRRMLNIEAEEPEQAPAIAEPEQAGPQAAADQQPDSFHA